MCERSNVEEELKTIIMLMHGKSQKETIHEELKRLSWSYMLYMIIQQAYWQACVYYQCRKQLDVVRMSNFTFNW